METESEIQVIAEIPGLDPSDVDVEVEDNLLTIRGNKREQIPDSVERWYLSERRYGQFSRSLLLPRVVEADQIMASIENGVLIVRVPRRQHPRPRRIEIRRSREEAPRGVSPVATPDFEITDRLLEKLRLAGDSPEEVVALLNLTEEEVNALLKSDLTAEETEIAEELRSAAQARNLPSG